MPNDGGGFPGNTRKKGRAANTGGDRSDLIASHALRSSDGLNGGVGALGKVMSTRRANPTGSEVWCGGEAVFGLVRILGEWRRRGGKYPRPPA